MGRPRASLDSIHFEARTAQMRANCGEKVARLAAWIKEHPGVEIRLTGYLAQDEAPQALPALTERRMRAVREALIAAGVPPARLRNLAAEDNRPRCAESSAESCQQWNRRVEVMASPPVTY